MSLTSDQHQGQGQNQDDRPVLLEVRDVSRRFVRRLDVIERLAARLGAGLREQTVHAVDRVSFSVREGEVVGLVGESGCGKSTLGRVIAGLHAPTSGEVLLAGQPVRLQAGQRPLVQMIFQDPYASLNPRMRVGEAIAQAPLAHGLIDKAQAEAYVAGLLQQVGLAPEMARRYPHQFSGGQRARVGIARALAVQPRFLVCDEAVAALDVSIQAQVINLLMSLRRDLGLTLLFISHDLGVIRHVCDRVVVMYLGRVVETGPIEAIYSTPHHPYTQALLAEVPRLDRRGQRYQPIRGEIPSPLDPPAGCHFHPRCPLSTERCATEVPVLRDIPIRRDPSAPVRAACHLLESASS
ncbi:MAG: ABC transporter ATP-binding protein [Burkholderiaceae bacterium]